MAPTARNNKPRNPRSCQREPKTKFIRLQKEDLQEDDDHSCQVCGRFFLRKQNLDLHLRSHNIVPQKTKARYSRDMAFPCPIPDCINHSDECALRDITAIKKHYGRKHCPKIWPCKYCGTKFAIKDDRKQHEKIHTDTVHHQCGCLKIFKRKDLFESHQTLCPYAVRENNAPQVTSIEEHIVADNPPTLMVDHVALDHNNDPPLYASIARTMNVPSSINVSNALPPPIGCSTYFGESSIAGSMNVLSSINISSALQTPIGGSIVLNSNNQPQATYTGRMNAPSSIYIPSAAENEPRGFRPYSRESELHPASRPVPLNVNIQPAFYNQMCAGGQQNGSSGSFLARNEYDLLVNDPALSFTDLLSFGTNSAPGSATTRAQLTLNPLGMDSAAPDSATIRAPTLNPLGFESYQSNAALVNPYMNRFSEFDSQGHRATDHLRSDSAMSLSCYQENTALVNPDMDRFSEFNSQGRRATDNLRSDSELSISLRSSNAQGFFTSTPPNEGMNPRTVAGRKNGEYSYFNFV